MAQPPSLPASATGDASVLMTYTTCTSGTDTVRTMHGRVTSADPPVGSDLTTT